MSLDDLPKRLDIKAGIMEMGEKIEWGSDTSIMREAATKIRELQAEICRLKYELERIASGNDRYETARLLNPDQWTEVWRLNVSTGKLFDEIIDDIKPFVRHNPQFSGPRPAESWKNETIQRRGSAETEV